MDVLSFLGESGSLLPYPSRPFQDQLASSEHNDSTPEHDSSLSPSSHSYYVEHGSDAGSSVSLLDHLDDHQLADNALLGTSLYMDEAFPFNADPSRGSLGGSVKLQRQEPLQRLLRPAEASAALAARAMVPTHGLLQTAILPAAMAHPHLATTMTSLQSNIHAQAMETGTGKGYKRPTTCQIQEENEMKRMKRLLKNRQSAVQSRARKKEYISGLEAKVKALSDQVQSLKQQLDTVLQENSTLRQQLGVSPPQNSPPSFGDCPANVEGTPSTSLSPEVLIQNPNLTTQCAGLLPGLVQGSQQSLQMLPLEQSTQYRLLYDFGAGAPTAQFPYSAFGSYASSMQAYAQLQQPQLEHSQPQTTAGFDQVSMQQLPSQLLQPQLQQQQQSPEKEKPDVQIKAEPESGGSMSYILGSEPSGFNSGLMGPLFSVFCFLTLSFTYPFASRKDLAIPELSTHQLPGKPMNYVGRQLLQVDTAPTDTVNHLLGAVKQLRADKKALNVIDAVRQLQGTKHDVAARRASDAEVSSKHAAGVSGAN